MRTFLTIRPVPTLRRLQRLALAGLGLLALTACQSLTPQMEAALRTPELPLALKASPSLASHSTASQAKWWQSLKDPELDAWMSLALQRNRDLAKSALRVQQSVIAAGKTALETWPRLGASLSTSVQGALSKESPATVRVDGVNLAAPSAPTLTTSNGLSLSLTQEIDLWGRVAQGKVQSELDLLMAQSDLEAAEWSLTAQVAEQYWSLALLGHKLEAAGQALEDARARLAMDELRSREGKLRLIELDRSRAALGEAQLARSRLLQQQHNALLAFALLMDEPPQNLALPRARLPGWDPEEPRAWPMANVLDRHPTVRRSRLALQQSLSKLKVAQISLYPQLSLSGSLSSGSSELAKILSNPFGSLALGLTLPVLDRARLLKDVGVAEISLDIAALEFREALYKALVEVDRQYGERQLWLSEGEQLRQKLEQAQSALQVTRLRHDNGVETLQGVREAAAVQRTLELSIQELRMRAWLNQVAILRAWGGPL